ncbi:MAG: serine/threonine-protein kinase [Cyanobacteria bacterium P01_A01_bin.68]
MLEAEQILQERYQLKQKLGQHSGRQTWLAEDISIEPAETVILKFLASSEELQWQDLKLFEREADILKQLSHAGIPDYLDYFTIVDGNSYFALVEEYLPGKSLKQLIERKQRFTEKELQNIAIDVLEILCYLHTLNPLVIHRDIKPSNLILGEDKRVYLIDFGAVQDSATAQGATFTVVGTYGYAPVEQFGGRTVPASDLYALGATLIHLATGTIPADLPQKHMRIQFQDKVSLSSSFIRWIEKLTEPDIEKRFSSASLALEALNGHLTVNSLAQITQTQGSPIKLNKSDNYLEIEIPPRGFKFDDVFLMIFCIIWLILFISMIVPSSSILFWIFGLYFVNLYLFASYGKIFIQFNKTDFLVKWKLFNFSYERIGKTSTINNIGSGPSSFEINNQKIKKISIHAKTEEYNFGAFLTDVERKWLIQEIKDWLDT